MARVLAQAHLLARRSLDAAVGRAVGDRGLAHRACRIVRHVRHPHSFRRVVGRDLDQARGILRQREHERRLRERGAAQERLDVEAVGHLDHRRQPVGDLERLHSGRRGEHRQRVRLACPERRVVAERLERLAQLAERAASELHRAELLDRLAREVLERDAVAFPALLRRGRHVDRDTRRTADGQQPLEIGAHRPHGRGLLTSGGRRKHPRSAAKTAAAASLTD
jgi:hypothetical protein